MDHRSSACLWSSYKKEGNVPRLFQSSLLPNCWTLLLGRMKQVWWGPSLEVDAQGGQEQREAEWRNTNIPERKFRVQPPEAPSLFEGETGHKGQRPSKYKNSLWLLGLGVVERRDSKDVRGELKGIKVWLVNGWMRPEDKSFMDAEWR